MTLLKTPDLSSDIQENITAGKRHEATPDASLSSGTPLTTIPKDLLDPSNHRREQIKNPKAPYFYYRECSYLPDPDPSTPVTAPGRIANFPAKMMAILSRPDLSHIISWMPHGRSWKVHKPREFEIKVIPMYFDHSKFSSFIRQANGWGFRRMIAKGPDRNSYYHELFLRGQPHLIKIMKRQTSGSRPQAVADTEPDFYRIAEEHPLPEIKVQVEDCPSLHSPRMLKGSVHESCGGSNYYSQHIGALQTQQQIPHYDHADFEPIPVVSCQTSTTLSHHGDLHPAPEQTAPHTYGEVHLISPQESPRYEPYDFPIHACPSNQWTETCVEPQVMPLDFEDPFQGGMRPVDFW